MDGSVEPKDLNIEQAKPANQAPAPKPKRQLKRLTLMGVPPLVIAVAVAGWLSLSAGIVTTDNATVAAARLPVAASIKGRVSDVYVSENQQVAAGDLLVRIDAGDFEIAVSSAEAQLAAARLQVEALRAAYGRAEADVATATTRSAFAATELARQKKLFDAGIASRQQLDAARNDADVAARNEAAAQESLATARANLGGDATIATDTHPLVLQALASLDQARADLADTEIRAPSAGIVTKVAQLQPGAYVQASQGLFWLIAGKPWIDAAFKENQLKDLAPGQPVAIHVDAYPDAELHGHVASFSPGTGSSFAILPAENATGNWVHVVQRLNVRIEIDDPAPEARLAVGLSARVKVDTREDSVRTAER